MAYIDRKDTRTGTRYYVRWRHGGGRAGKTGVEPFTDETRAERFVSLVNANGQRLPDLDVLRAMGFGDVAEKYAPAAQAATSVLSVAEWVERYIDTLAEPITSENQIRQYRSYLRSYIAGAELGTIPVTRTSPDEADCAKWRNAMSAGGGRNGRPLAGNTVRQVINGLLRPAFGMIARKGRRDVTADLPLDNPWEAVRLPEKDAVRPKTRLNSEAEMAIVYAAAVIVGLGDVVLFMLATGLRWGEVMGLTRGAFDWENGEFTVHTVARRKRGKWVLSPKPKTQAGWRTVGIPVELAGMLRARYAVAAVDGVPLFAGPGGGVWQYGEWSDRWTELLDQARGLGLTRHITAHGLRRTNLTRLHLAGVPDQAIKAHGGHTNIQMTLGVYVDTDREGRDLVAAAADGIITAARSTPPQPAPLRAA